MVSIELIDEATETPEIVESSTSEPKAEESPKKSTAPAADEGSKEEKKKTTYTKPKPYQPPKKYQPPKPYKPLSNDAPPESITEPDQVMKGTMGNKTQAQWYHELRRHKEEGNIHFNANVMNAALFSYTKAEDIFKYITLKNKSTPEAKELRVGLLNNISMVHFKEKKYQQSRDYATKALLVDPKNVKALYRRALVHRAEGDCHSAKADLREALKYDPKNATVQKELMAVKKEVEDDKEKAKKVVKEAFLNENARSCFLYDDKEEEAKKNPPKPQSGVYPARYRD